MKHINKNKLCAIDIRTTGDTPGVHELYELAIVPLSNGFIPDKSIMPYHVVCDLRRSDKRPPVKPDQHLLDSWTAETVFHDYYTKMGIGQFKRIQMIAHNVPKTCAFLMDWLGYGMDHTPIFYDYFDKFHHRDIVSAALLYCDLAWRNDLPYQIQKQDFSYLCRSLNVKTHCAFSHASCLERAFAVAECWRKMHDFRLNSINIDTWTPENIDYDADKEDEEEAESGDI